MNQAEARKQLSKRSLYVATPCYGGAMMSNYTESLLKLATFCSEIGLNCRVQFLNGESLVTRARNTLVAEFIKSGFTDFLFIDADTGFDAQEIVALLLRKEEIISVPYVKKRLNLKALVNCLKKQNFNIPEKDLGKIAGEYVLYQTPGFKPKSTTLERLIRSRELIEVTAAGTGLLLIQRPAFEKIRKAFPDRVYMEGSSQIYVYFQDGIEAETGKFVGEDFGFCFLARKSGLKIYAAPWIKTTHVGSYSYEGDVEAFAKYSGVL